MKKTPLNFVGIENGEYYNFKYDADGVLISRTPLTKKKDLSLWFMKGDFFTVHRRLCKILKKKKNYSNLTFRVLFELLERIDLDNRIKSFREAELAEILESHQPHINTALKVLREDEVIKKIKYDYYFTPKFVRYINDGFEKFENSDLEET